MGIPRLFKTPQHKRFSYKSIYYNEEKEDLKNRIEEAKNEIIIENKNNIKHSSKIKGQFKRPFQSPFYQENKQSNTRLILIAIALFILAYYLFYY